MQYALNGLGRDMLVATAHIATEVTEAAKDQAVSNLHYLPHEIFHTRKLMQGQYQYGKIYLPQV
jgi:hypothetical protein